VERKSVSSSNIESVGYDAATETLEIKFKSGGVWLYKHVPLDTYTKFMAADSMGKFFYANIKGQFDAEPAL
jgi:hypothetical protein